MNTLLITRPLSSALSLANKMKTALPQVKSVIFPAIEICNMAENPFSYFSLDTIDYIIFTSPAAVEKSKPYLSLLPSHITLFAPGKDTAEKIQQLGLGKAH